LKKPKDNQTMPHLSLPFAIAPTTLAGLSLWSLALYLGFSPISDWVMEQLGRKMNEVYASLLSIVPFLGAGGLCNWGVEVSLGTSWALSMGILACMGCGVYELGRQDGRSQE
jgi:hypothetical protein